MNAGKEHLRLIMVDHMLQIALIDLVYPQWLPTSRYSEQL